MVPFPPDWLYTWSKVIAGLGSVILTILLVILYKRQQEQLAAQHEAILEVTDVEWHNRDRGIFWVSNFGNGVAKDLFLTTLVKSDSGDHRTHAVRSTALTRIDKDGEWTNVLQAGEEDIPFHAKSKVGQQAPSYWSDDWTTLRFSPFIREAKENGATEVKFCHVIHGAELSGNACWDQVQPMTQSVDPQEFETDHSLGNLPSVTKHGLDKTFYPYFRSSFLRKWIFWVYAKGVRGLNRVIPKITLRPRVLDASGTRRVKRVLLKHQLRLGLNILKNWILNFPSSVWENITNLPTKIRQKIPGL